MKYLLYILAVGLLISIYGFVNTKASYKQEVEVMRTYFEINPSPEIELKIDKNEKKLKKQLKIFKLLILGIILIIVALCIKQYQFKKPII